MRNLLIALLSALLFLSACGEKEVAERTMPDRFPVLEAELPGNTPPLSPAAMVMVELIEVESEDFTQWSLNNEMGPTAATALRREVQSWLRGERARSVTTLAVQCREGRKAKTSSVREFLYPADHSYLSVVTETEQPEEKDEEKKKGESEKKKPAPPKPDSVVKDNPSPVGFDFREAGITLEVSITSIDPASGQIEMSVSPDLVHHIETVEWKAAEGNDLGDFRSPSFDRNNFNTSLTLQSGYFSLLGMTKTPENLRTGPMKDSLLLAFIRADSNQPKAP